MIWSRSRSGEDSSLSSSLDEGAVGTGWERRRKRRKGSKPALEDMKGQSDVGMGRGVGGLPGKGRGIKVEQEVPA